MTFDQITEWDQESLAETELHLQSMMVRLRELLAMPGVTSETFAEISAIFNNVAYILGKPETAPVVLGDRPRQRRREDVQWPVDRNLETDHHALERVTGTTRWTESHLRCRAHDDPTRPRR